MWPSLLRLQSFPSWEGFEPHDQQYLKRLLGLFQKGMFCCPGGIVVHVSSLVRRFSRPAIALVRRVMASTVAAAFTDSIVDWGGSSPFLL